MDDEEDKDDAEEDGEEGRVVGEMDFFTESAVDESGESKADGDAEKEGFGTVEETFESNHVVEFFSGHANGTKSGKFATAEEDIGIDGIEDIGETNERNNGDKTIAEDLDEKEEVVNEAELVGEIHEIEIGDVAGSEVLFDGFGDFVVVFGVGVEDAGFGAGEVRVGSEEFSGGDENVDGVRVGGLGVANGRGVGEGKVEFDGEGAEFGGSDFRILGVFLA